MKDSLILMCRHNGFGIYRRSDDALRRFLTECGYFACRYEVYLPGDSPEALDAAEWESDDFRECIDFIDSYEY